MVMILEAIRMSVKEPKWIGTGWNAGCYHNHTTQGTLGHGRTFIELLLPQLPPLMTCLKKKQLKWTWLQHWTQLMLTWASSTENLLIQAQYPIGTTSATTVQVYLATWPQPSLQRPRLVVKARLSIGVHLGLTGTRPRGEVQWGYPVTHLALVGPLQLMCSQEVQAQILMKFASNLDGFQVAARIMFTLRIGPFPLEPMVGRDFVNLFIFLNILIIAYFSK